MAPSTARSGFGRSSGREALELLVSRPTVNIEGLVGGYTGPGGKTILPHKASAKLDLRLVPDMKAAEALGLLGNTRVAYTSDHGELFGAQGVFRGGAAISGWRDPAGAASQTSAGGAAESGGTATLSSDLPTSQASLEAMSVAPADTTRAAANNL